MDWIRLPAHDPVDVADAWLRIAESVDGRIVLEHLLTTYLFAAPVDLREVGKQDVIRELIDLAQQAILARQHHHEQGDNEWPM